MKYWLTLIFSVFILTQNQTTKAAAPIALTAPVVTVGALELLQLTAAAAATYGVISVAQNEGFQNKVGAVKEKVIEATVDMVEKVEKDSVELFDKLARAVGVKKDCSPGNKTDRAVATCTSAPEVCCKDFFSKFKGQSEHTHGGFRIWKNIKHNKLMCCLEWDHLHGGFEIFDRHGNHMGERGCDDLNEDPCANTESRGRHAMPASSTHRPRTAACKF